ncbi:MAG: rhomboid family intramembrane serine protease [Sulfuritalea sp.]|nr:rhomboid family intramembrane serine protease [Sulfuritalea sp.]
MVPPDALVRNAYSNQQRQKSATVFILYSLFNGFTHAGIDNAAHVGGLIGGALSALPWRCPCTARLLRWWPRWC